MTKDEAQHSRWIFCEAVKVPGSKSAAVEQPKATCYWHNTWRIAVLLFGLRSSDFLRFQRF
jgi:hypothetical protein